MICASLYLLVLIRVLPRHLAEKIPVLQPLKLGRMPYEFLVDRHQRALRMAPKECSC